MEDKNKVLSNVAITGQVTGGISDETLLFYKEIQSYIKEAQINQELQGNILYEIRDTVIDEAEKWNNYIDFVLNSYLGNIDKNIEIISKFINTITQGQDSFLKDIFKNNSLYQQEEKNAENEFRVSILTALSTIIDSIRKDGDKGDKLQLVNAMTMPTSPMAPISVKEIAKDEKQAKTLTGQLKNILDSYALIISKYGNMKEFKNITKFKDKFLKIEAILFSIIQGKDVKRLKEIIVFNNVTGNLSVAIETFLKLIDNINNKVDNKILLLFFKNIYFMDKSYDYLLWFIQKINETEIDTKTAQDKLSSVQKAINPLFKIFDSIVERSILKDIIKSYLFLNLSIYAINRIIFINELIKNFDYNDVSYENIGKAVDKIKYIVNNIIDIESVLGYIATLFTGDNLIFILDSLAHMANEVEKISPKIIKQIETYQDILKPFNNLIYRLTLSLPGLWFLNKTYKIYEKGFDSVDNILVLLGAVATQKTIDRNSIKNIKNIKEGLEEFNGIFIPLLLSGLGLVEVIILEKIYEKGIDSLDNILNYLSSTLSKEYISKNQKKQLKEICEFVSMLGQLTYSLLLTGIGMTALILIAPVIIAGLFVIKGIVILIEWLFNGNNMKELRKNISAFSYSLLLITTSFLAFALSLLVISQIALSPQLLLGTVAFFGYIVATMGIMYLLSKLNKDVRAAALSLTIVSTALVALSLSLFFVSLLTSNINYSGMVQFFLCTAAVIGVMYLLSMFKGNIIMGSLTIALLSISLIILGSCILAVSNLMNDVSFENLGILAGATALFALLFGIIGIPVVAGFVALGSVVMLLLSFTLIEFAKGIKDLSDIFKGLSKKDIENITDNFDTFLSNISWTFTKNMPKLVIAFPGILSAIKLGKAVSNLALGIQSIANLTMPTAWDENGKPVKFRNMNKKDFENASINIALILSTLVGPLEAFGGDGNRKQWKAIKKGIKYAGRVGTSISNIATGIQSMALLNMPIEWDENGKPIKFRNLTREDFTDAGINIQTILETLIDPLAEFGGASGGKNWRQKMKANKKGIKLAGQLGTSISNLASGVQSMALLNMPIEWDENGKPIKYAKLQKDDFKNVTENINAILSTFIDGIVDWAGKHPEYFDSGWFTKSLAGKAIDIVSKIGNSISNLAIGIQAFGNLKAPKFNEKGEIIGYDQLDLNKVKISENINKVFDILIEVVSNKDKIKLLKNASKDIDRIAPGILKLVEIYSSVSSASKDFDENKIILIPLLNNTLIDSVIEYENKKTQLLKGYEIANDILSLSERSIKNINGLTDSDIKNFEKLNSNYEKFVVTSNKINIKPINAMSQMLDKMNTLIKSQGSLDKFTDAIGNKLTPVLVELVETLTDLQAKYEYKQSGNSNNTSTVTTQNNQSSQTGSNSQKSEDMGQLINKINSLVSSIQSGLNVKVQGDVSIKNSMSAGPLKVSAGI